MARQGGVEGWEKDNNPSPSEYLVIWKTYPAEDEIRTERDRRSYPITIRVWDKVEEDGEYAVETETGRSDREEVHASRDTFTDQEDAKSEAKRRMRRINEDQRIFGTSITEDELDHVIGNIRHSSRNQGQLGSRLKELGDKLVKGHKESQRRIP